MGKKFKHAYEGSRSPHASALHPPGFCKKKKSSDTFLTDLLDEGYTSIELPMLVWNVGTYSTKTRCNRVYFNLLYAIIACAMG